MAPPKKNSCAFIDASDAKCPAKLDIKDFISFEKELMDEKLRRIKEELKLEKELTGIKINNVEHAIVIAASSMEKRLDGMNEFRNAMADQNAQFLTKSSFDVLHERVEKDVKDLLNYKWTSEGKASQTSMIITLIISIVGILIGIFSIALRFFGK